MSDYPAHLLSTKLNVEALWLLPVSFSLVSKFGDPVVRLEAVMVVVMVVVRVFFFGPSALFIV